MIRFVSQHAALFAALLLAMSLPASASPLEWRDVAGDIDQIVERREKVDFEISDSEGLASRRLSEMMDAAVGILADDGNSGYRARLAALREEMDSSRDRIAGLRFDMASAPKGDQSSILGYVGLAPASEIELGKQIAAEEDRLRLVEARYKETRSRFVDRLTSLGIDITPEQADGLLSMATADDIMAMHIAFANMKSINASLRDATVRARLIPLSQPPTTGSRTRLAFPG